MNSHPNPDLIALGVQQPWAELIVRGIKTVEVRSQPTRVRGQIYIYASKRFSTLDDAQTAVERFNLDPESLPRQKVVGTVSITGSESGLETHADAACLRAELFAGRHVWTLAEPEQFEVPLSVVRVPYGVWFYPYRLDP